MSLDTDTDAPISRWWAILTLACGLTVTAAAQKITSFAVAEALGICTAVSFMIGVSIWHLRRQRWFQPFVAVATALQGLAIWLIPWPKDHTFQKSDLNFVWLDFLVLIAVGVLIERVSGLKKLRG